MHHHCNVLGVVRTKNHWLFDGFRSSQRFRGESLFSRFGALGVLDVTLRLMLNWHPQWSCHHPVLYSLTKATTPFPDSIFICWANWISSSLSFVCPENIKIINLVVLWKKQSHFFKVLTAIAKHCLVNKASFEWQLEGSEKPGIFGKSQCFFQAQWY